MNEIRKRSCSVIVTCPCSPRTLCHVKSIRYHHHHYHHIHGLTEPSDMADESGEEEDGGQVINLLHAIKCDKVSVNSFNRL